MDHKIQKELDYYLNSPVYETSDEPSSSSCDSFVALDPLILTRGILIIMISQSIKRMASP